MSRPAALAGIAAAHAAVNVAGLVVAVRRRKPYRLPLLHGSPQHVLRDSVWMGTAYSAPLPMFGAQLWAVATLRRRPDDFARRIIGGLGAVMVAGYLMEHSGREHLRHWDPVESPIVATGVGLAAVMAVLGMRGSPGSAGHADGVAVPDATGGAFPAASPTP